MRLQLLTCSILLLTFTAPGFCPGPRQAARIHFRDKDQLVLLGENGCEILFVVSPTGSDAQISVCGIAPLNMKTRIVGDPGTMDFPWQASLHSYGHVCGGSLINSQWVLTAAHCFRSTSASDVIIYLGRQTQQNPNLNQVSSTVAQIINHPNYNSTTNDNDITLLQLSSAVTFTDYIKPVCLAAAGSTFPNGLDCWVTGWGNINSSVPLPSPQTLQEVDVLIVSNSQCNNTYGTITSNMICAGPTAGGKDSGQGNSGGTLVSRTPGTRWVQTGIVSFGNGCPQSNNPGVYTPVSQYQSWINSHITGDTPGYITYSADSSSAAGMIHFISLSIPLLLSILPILFSLFVLY